jgi:hypothetical protein
MGEIWALRERSDGLYEPITICLEHMESDARTIHIVRVIPANVAPHPVTRSNHRRRILSKLA